MENVKLFLNRIKSISELRIRKVLGYFLLLPSILSVFFFISDIFFKSVGRSTSYSSTETFYYARYQIWDDSSNIVLYIGLTAAIGVFLIRDTDSAMK